MKTISLPMHRIVSAGTELPNGIDVSGTILRRTIEIQSLVWMQRPNEWLYVFPVDQARHLLRWGRYGHSLLAIALTLEKQSSKRQTQSQRQFLQNIQTYKQPYINSEPTSKSCRNITTGMYVLTVLTVLVVIQKVCFGLTPWNPYVAIGMSSRPSHCHIASITYLPYLLACSKLISPEQWTVTLTSQVKPRHCFNSANSFQFFTPSLENCLKTIPMLPAAVPCSHTWRSDLQWR